MLDFLPVNGAGRRLPKALVVRASSAALNWSSTASVELVSPHVWQRGSSTAGRRSSAWCSVESGGGAVVQGGHARDRPFRVPVPEYPPMPRLHLPFRRSRSCRGG